MRLNTTSLVFDLAVALVAGAIAATAILPFSAIALVFCVLFVISTARTRTREGHQRLAATRAIAATLVFVSLVAAAYAYRPAKVVEQQLNRRIVLPAPRMTLAELAFYSAYDRRGFPFRMSFGFAEDAKNIVVEWPAQDLTVRDFLDAIESQTVLRRKFYHCGNGYTVLWGGDCSLGLSICDPEFRDPQFDLSEYLRRRDFGGE